MRQMVTPIRSLMFVPGSSTHMLRKALTLEELDVAMLDLEDGVSWSQKSLARRLVAEAIRESGGTSEAAVTPRVFIRINSIKTGTEDVEADLDACLLPGVDGIVIPKAHDARTVEAVEKEVAIREKRLGLDEGVFRFILAIESARGLLNVRAVAHASDRVVGLMLGAEDYALDLGLPVRRQGESRDLVFARSTLINAAVDAGIWSFDGVWTDLSDMDGCNREARQARQLGFTGKSTFHPSQIPLINRAFLPSSEDIAFAQEIVTAFEEAEAAGAGAVAVGGQLVDLPIVRRAQQTLEGISSGRFSIGDVNPGVQS